VIRIVGLALVLAACSEGAVHVRVELPENATLSPLASGLAQLTLVAERDGEPAQTTTRLLPAMPVGAPAVGFGDLGVGPGARVSLVGRTAAGRLVGFGRAAAPLDVAPGDTVEIAIPLRRPFAYVAGGGRLGAFDTTVEPADPFATRIESVVDPVAVTVTPDGAEIVVVAQGALSLLFTGTHADRGSSPVPLMPGVTSVAVSPDSRRAVAVHAGAGVSLVDLAALRRGAAGATFIEIENAGAAALTTDTAYVLAEPSLPGPPPDYVEQCGRPSRLVPVPLAGGEPRAPIILAGAARDLVATPDGQALLVAQPCQNVVNRVTTNGSSQIRVVSVPNPTDVAVAVGRVWAVGRTGEAGAVRLVLAAASLDGSSPSRLDFPLTQEVAQSTDLTEGGQFAEVRLGADRVDAVGLSVLPDGRHVALLVHGSYHGDEVLRGGTTILPRMDLETYEYALMDVTSGVAAQRLRTSCEISWERNTALLDDWACAVLPGQDAVVDEFVPTQLAVTYGGH
jgi:hypothetical protein